jgi:putative FmdB family regulatory protein
MPTTEYTCPKCGHLFKRVAFIDDPPSRKICPKCGTAVDPDRNYSNPLTGNIPTTTN